MPNEQTDKLEVARIAKEKAKTITSEIENVNGVGLINRNGKYSIRVYVSELSDRLEQLPNDIDGVSFEIKVVGEINKSKTSE